MDNFIDVWIREFPLRVQATMFYHTCLPLVYTPHICSTVCTYRTVHVDSVPVDGEVMDRTVGGLVPPLLRHFITHRHYHWRTQIYIRQERTVSSVSKVKATTPGIALFFPRKKEDLPWEGFKNNLRTVDDHSCLWIISRCWCNPI